MAARALTGACLLGLAALFAACDDDDAPSTPATGGRAATGGAVATGGRAGAGGSTDAGGADSGGANAGGAGGDGEVPLAPCLDRPDVLPRPPVGQLPCDLLPPDFGR